MVSQIAWDVKMIRASKVQIINCSKEAGKQIYPKGGFPDQFWNWFLRSFKTSASFQIKESKIITQNQNIFE